MDRFARKKTLSDFAENANEVTTTSSATTDKQGRSSIAKVRNRWLARMGSFVWYVCLVVGPLYASQAKSTIQARCDVQRKKL